MGRKKREKRKEGDGGGYRRGIGLDGGDDKKKMGKKKREKERWEKRKGKKEKGWGVLQVVHLLLVLKMNERDGREKKSWSHFTYETGQVTCCGHCLKNNAQVKPSIHNTACVGHIIMYIKYYVNKQLVMLVVRNIT
eukprot:UN10959